MCNMVISQLALKIIEIIAEILCFYKIDKKYLR